MKTLRRFAPVAFVLAVSPVASAHPGHDDHELTWDFGHLIAHPGATIMCLAVLGLAGWVLWRETRADGLLRRKTIKSRDSRRED